ncbi:MAG: helix-turn-helix domain-containing protein [Marinomonas colpomeniae]
MSNEMLNIEFKKTSLLKVGFEVFDIRQLYDRAETGELAYLDQPHRVNFHNLILYTGNAGEHFVDFHAFPVEKNALVLVNKGQIHAFDLVNKPSATVVIFTDHYLDEVTAAIDARIFAPTQFLSSYCPSFLMSESQALSLHGIFALITAEFDQLSTNVQYVKVLFAAILCKVSELRPDIYHYQMSASQIKSFERFVTCLERNYATMRDANEYAQLIATSYKTLNKVCKIATNFTVKQLIDAHVVLEAKRRLSIDNIQVQQVASDLGFDEVTNFVKYFKKHTLMTPSQFKQKV